MKKLLLIFYLFVAFTSNATDYYVSASEGLNSNNGTSPLTPWQTIGKVNSSSFLPNDNIYFKCNDIWAGALILPSSGTAGNQITIGSYGTGAKPLISGFELVSGWVSQGNGIYRAATQAANTCNAVTVNGTNTPLGRYPKNSWLTFESFTGTTKTFNSVSNYNSTVAGTILISSTAHGLSTGNTITIAGTTSYDGVYTVTVVSVNTFYVTKTYVSSQTGSIYYNQTITDNQLSGSPSWTGAEVVIRKLNWIIDRSLILNHSGTTITYSPGSGYDPNGTGEYNYFLQKSPNACTSLGDWYVKDGYIYMYFGANSPSNYTVKVSFVDRTVYASSKNYIKIDGLKFDGASSDAIYFTSCANATVTNCDFINQGGFCVRYNYCDNGVITYNTATEVNGTAIDVVGANHTVTDNTITKTGLYLGMGNSSGSTYIGIKTRGASGLIEYNHVTDVGYLGIWFTNTQATVRYNLVDKFCQWLTDGGGVYGYWGNDSTTVQNQEIYNNIVMNSKGNGLYSDGVMNHSKFHDNTVINIDKWGIHQNQPRFNEVYDNTFYDCKVFSDLTNQNTLGVNAYSSSFTNNTLVQQNSNQWLWLLTDGTKNYMEARNTSNNNKLYMFSAADTVSKNVTIYPSYSHTYQTLAQLRATGWETTSTVTNIDGLNIIIKYNASKVATSIPLDGSYNDLAGVGHNGSITLQPYTSAILIKQPDTNPTNTKKPWLMQPGNKLWLINGKYFNGQ